MHRKLSASIFVLIVLFSEVSSQHEGGYLICKPVKNLFLNSEHGINSSNQRGPQGAPGKRGARGFPGVPGPVGPMPEIDWKAIDQHIKVQVDARLSCSGVVYDRYCYKLIIKAMNFNGGGGKSLSASECAYRGGGELVDIENEEMYNLLYTYIQDSWVAYIDSPSSTYVYVWLASRYVNGALRDWSGSEVYAKWHPSHPISSYSDVALKVGTKAGQGPNYVGMQTRSSLYSYAVPLCRFSMN